MKRKTGWVAIYAPDDADVIDVIEYFDGSTLSPKLRDAYIFDNMYVANSVCQWWSQQTKSGSYYIQEVIITRSVELCDTPLR